jgi:sugar lactone lactonase YvrE
MTAEILDAELPLSQLGEGACWCSQNSTLYWVDIAGQTVHAYHLPDKARSSWRLSKEVSFAFPQEDGHLLVGLSDGVYEYDPESGEEAPIALLDLPSGHRLNDGKLDPEGRLWVGTINTADEPSETAALYVLRNDRLEEVERGYANANGKAWSPDGAVMYHADTSRGTIWTYDYDIETGTPSNKRVFVRHQDWNPDGLSIDPDGNLLVAVFGGGRIEVYSHRGDRMSDIELPAPNVTSCDLAKDGTLFVTTAFDGMSSEARAKAPQSGAIFKCRYSRGHSPDFNSP